MTGPPRRCPAGHRAATLDRTAREQGNGGNAGSELGRFLRARRARVTPAEVGLPAGTGLRDLAARAARTSSEPSAAPSRTGNTSGRKTFHHPLIGDVTFGYQAMDGAHGHRLVAYHAGPGTPEYDAMLLLDAAADGPATVRTRASRSSS